MALGSAFERSSVSSTAQPPLKILFAILDRLDSPRDLYNASLVCHAWREVAIDDRLWEFHYWRCYKPLTSSVSDDQDEQKLYRYRESKRRAAMLTWLHQTAICPPSTELFEAYSDRARQGLLRDSRFKEVSKEVWFEMVCRIEATKPPESVPPGQIQSTPAFLEQGRSEDSSDPLPSFRHLFAKRMNLDDAIMQELRSHVDLKSNRLEALLNLVREHGEASRPLFAALCATETMTDFNLERFLPPHDTNAAPWPRARDIYDCVTHYQMEPQTTHCLALQHIATKALGHFQRREGVRLMKDLQEQDQARAFESPRAKLDECSKAFEQAITSVALFRAGESSDIREYLDLLALFIFADLQAEDNAAARDGKPYGLPADPEAMPAGSTRHYLARIIFSLRMLRFGAASAPDSTDVDNAFINVVLYCPAQRLATPMMFASIVSAVARRLGIAASISNVTNTRALLVVVENAEEPATWQDGSKPSEWKRFFADAADGHQGHLFSKSVDFICEAEALKSFLLMQGAPEDSIEHLLEPASPLSILERVASEIMRLVKAKRTNSIMRESGKELFDGQDDLLAQSAWRHQLGHLRFYLEARDGPLPAPLLLPTPPPSIACFDEQPSVHARRMGPVRLAEGAEYCAEWIWRIVAEKHANAAAREAAIAKTSILLAHRIGEGTLSGLYGCDYRLLFHLDELRKGKEGVIDGAFRLSSAYKIFVKELLHEDAQQGKGFGPLGGADGQYRPPAARARANNRASHPSVKCGVGTVFRYKPDGWLGVIVGWDAEVESTSKQPFYKVISEHDWDADVAQSDILPVKVAAESSRAAAVAQLKRIVHMFEIRTWGKAFDTLRVEPWDEGGLQGSEGKVRERGRQKGKEKEQGEAQDARGREKGQVYLVPNAWMRQAWPYD